MFGLVEAANITNRQFAQSNPSLNQTKCEPKQLWQKNTFLSKNTCVFF